MRSEAFDNSLLDDLEEWITMETAILYVKMVYGLALTPHSLWELGGKFGFIKEFSGVHLFHARTLDSTVSRCYFPTIPKGFDTVDAVCQKLSFLPRRFITSWLREKRLNTRKVEIGTEELILISADDVRKLYRESRKNGGYKDYEGRDTRHERNKRSGGRKQPRQHREREKKPCKGKRYQSRLEWWNQRQRNDMDS